MIDSQAKSKEKNPKLLRQNNTTTSEPTEVATIFVEYLEKVFSYETDPAFDEANYTTVNKSLLGLFTCSESDAPECLKNTAEVEQIIKITSGTNGAPGLDAISNKVLNNIPQDYFELIAVVANNHGTCPQSRE